MTTDPCGTARYIPGDCDVCDGWHADGDCPGPRCEGARNVTVAIPQGYTGRLDLADGRVVWVQEGGPVHSRGDARP